MALTKIDLEFPLGDTSARLHCPACGAEILGATDVGECPHLLFLYFGSAGCFASVDPALEAEVDAAYADEDEDRDTMEIALALLEASPTPGLLVLSQTTGGMACGPVWETSWAAFSLRGEPYVSPQPSEA